jgi:nucleotide-binding universal stress UspA family protein
MSVSAVRRIVVGVDGTAESAAALRWACREAALRRAEVHAVHVREAPCHSMPSYAVPAQGHPGDVDVDIVWASVRPELAPGVLVRTEVANGLTARVLLERCADAEMLVLGTSGDLPGAVWSPGPVIRACLRRAPCPVVVISDAQEPPAPRADEGGEARASAGLQAGAGVPVPAGAAGAAGAWR